MKENQSIEWRVHVRIKVISIMLMVCLMGVLSGCGAKKDSSSDSTTTLENFGEIEEESDLAEKESFVDHEENKVLETVNSFKMPLMDDTALIMTIKKCFDAYGSRSIFVKEEYEYDKEGRILRHINDSYSTSGGRREYEYDAAGNLTRETCYELRDGEVRYWIEYRDAKDGAVDELLRIGSKYEGEGNLVSENVYNREGDLIRYILYREDRTAYAVIEYKGADCMLRQIDYDKQGNLVSRREFEYDAAGNQTLMADYDADGNIEVHESYDCDTYQVIHCYWPTENEYDTAGNLIKSVDYDYEGNIESVTEYIYDEAGNLLQKIDNGYVYEYEYDSAGNMIKKIEVPDLQWKEYEYDSENRVIKMTEYVHGKVYDWYEYEYKMIGGCQEASLPQSS